VFNAPVRRIAPFITSCALTAAAALAVAAPAGATVTELGQPSDAAFPAASCPDSCQAIGGITGFQVQFGAHKNPYVITQPGKIVAFTIRMGKPNANQQQYFTNLFGGQPQARVTILQQVRSTHTHKVPRWTYQVVAQSEVFNLGPYFGSDPSFALAKPIAVKKGQTVAITVPTWVPAFGVGLGSDQAWRSSRDSKSCNGTSQAAQQTVKGQHPYQCFYRTARLLYSVTVVPTPTATSTTAPQKPKR
jgi:hypothetical protein